MKEFQIPKTRFRRSNHVGRDIKLALDALHETATIDLHLGSGSSRIKCLINCDLYNSNADRRIDACNLNEFENNSVDLIEHHHMIEHLSFSDFEQAMVEWNRVLRPSGYLIFTCPDIRAVSLAYLKYSLLKGLRNRDEKIDYVIKMFVGSQEHEGMFHKNHFDADRVRRIFPHYGFEILFIYSPFPKRSTPSLFVVARNCS